VLVGDLHLTDVPTPAANRLAALAGTLAAHADTGRGSVSLVLMGDVLDLVQVSSGTHAQLDGRLAHGDPVALAKLERIARANGVAFSALGRIALAGGTVELLAGNHDQELARPAVQKRIRDLLLPPDAPAAARARIAFHPFALYRSGVLYAEHGHRYHAINASPPALRAHLDGADERIGHPLGSLLTAILSSAPSDSQGVARARAREAARLVPALVRSLARALAARQRPPARTIGGDARLLAHVAEATGLPARAVAAIDRLPPPEVGIRRMLGLTVPDEPNMARAAREVHAALSAEGAATPFYCFGHTHVADRRRLDAAVEYLNAGAFGLGMDSTRSHTYVIVKQRPGKAPLARLCDAGDGPDAPSR
jgi:UDP-2,3-diacylglucosamine pyrophosphatase LpxH